MGNRDDGSILGKAVLKARDDMIKTMNEITAYKIEQGDSNIEELSKRYREKARQRHVNTRSIEPNF